MSKEPCKLLITRWRRRIAPFRARSYRIRRRSQAIQLFPWRRGAPAWSWRVRSAPSVKFNINQMSMLEALPAYYFRKDTYF